MNAASLGCHAVAVACALLLGGTAFVGAHVLPRAGTATQAPRLPRLATRAA